MKFVGTLRCAVGYRHYHPDTQKALRKVVVDPGRFALVLSAETERADASPFAERLSTERTMGGWLAVEAVCREPVSRSKNPC